MLSHTDIRRLLGELSDEQIARILRLKPELADVEAAALCLDGRADALEGSRERPSGVIAEIADIAAEDEDDPSSEPPRAAR